MVYGWQQGWQWKSSKVLLKLILMGTDTWGEIDEISLKGADAETRVTCLPRPWYAQELKNALSWD